MSVGLPFRTSPIALLAKAECITPMFLKTACLLSISATLFLPQVALAQSGGCLSPLVVETSGSLTLTEGDETRVLDILSTRIEDPLFDAAETLSTAVFVQGETPLGGPFNLWSISAYPQGFADRLASGTCGEDLLDALDAWRAVGDLDNPLALATAVLSPSQAAAGPFFRRDLQTDQAAAAEEALATAARFEASLPDRAGAMVLNFRTDLPDPRALITDPTISPVDLMQLLEDLESPDALLRLSDPMRLSCPCDMEVVEAHVFGDSGPPFAGPSESWQMIQARKAPFTVTLTTVSENADGTYAVAGTFTGALFDMTPVEGEERGLSALTGIPDVETGETPTPITGSFTLDRVLPASLSRLPKVF